MSKSKITRIGLGGALSELIDSIYEDSDERLATSAAMSRNYLYDENSFSRKWEPVLLL